MLEATPVTEDLTSLTIATYDRVAEVFALGHQTTTLERDLERFAQAIVGAGSPERYRILDAGCGPGQDARWLAERGFQVVGVDLSSGMLREARRQASGIALVQADLRDLDLPEASFDGIWCAAALVHLDRSEVPGVLDSFNRLLGHGYLRLSVKLGSGEEISERGFGPGNPRRFTYFGRHEIELLVDRAGFEIHDLVKDPAPADEGHPWLSILAQTTLRSPLLGASAVIFDAEGRVLLSDRADGRGWNLPAGIVDDGEAPQEAVLREAREETGLTIEIERFLGVYTGRRAQRTRASPVGVVTHAFLCRVLGGELIPTNETLRHGWFDPRNLPAPMATMRHARIIQDAVAMREGKLEQTVITRYVDG